MKKRSLLIFFGAVFLLVLLWMVYRLWFSQSPDEASITSRETVSPNKDSVDIIFPVEVSVAHKGDLIKRLQTTGVLRANREIEIIARVSGEIVSVGAYNGKYVQAGDTLVQFDEREYRVALEKAKTALLGAQMEYMSMNSYAKVDEIDKSITKKRNIDLKENFEEITKNFLEGKISSDDYERAKRNYETQVAYINVNPSDVMANKSGLSAALEAHVHAKMNLEAAKIQASFTGYVADCELIPGMQIQAGKVMMKLVDVSSLLVDVEVLENEIGNIVIGRKAKVTVNTYPDKVFLGTTKYVNPIVDQKAKTVKVTIELKDGRPSSGPKSEIRNPKLNLLPGMFATVRIETDILSDRLLVPKQALLVRDQRTLVFKKEGGLAKWCYVDIGEENDEYVEIRSGIIVGDTVITDGHYILAHDAKIKIIK